MSRKTEIIEAVKPGKEGKGLGKDLLMIVGIGLAAGVGLVAATDKVMKKFFPKNEEEDEYYFDESDYDDLDDLDD